MKKVSKVLTLLLEKALDAAIRSNSKQAVKAAYLNYQQNGLIATKDERQYALHACKDALDEIDARRAYAAQ